MLTGFFVIFGQLFAIYVKEADFPGDRKILLVSEGGKSKRKGLVKLSEACVQA